MLDPLHRHWPCSERIAGVVRAGALACLFGIGLVPAARAGDPPAQASGEPAAAVAAPTETPPAVAALVPRMQLHVPSLRRLVAEADRSHAGVFLRHGLRVLRELSSLRADGVDVEAAGALLAELAKWPDTALNIDLYAPDTEGRARWAAVLDWPHGDTVERLDALLRAPQADDLLTSLHLEPRTDNRHALVLPAQQLAVLQPAADGRAMICSHTGLTALPPPDVTPVEAASGEVLLASRMHFGGTEADSGATWLSKVRLITHVDYCAAVAEDGRWSERYQLFWPPIAGVGAKAIVDRVKQSFFVPAEAFGSAVISSMALPGLLDGALGLGPQIVMTAPGEIEMMDQATTGPLAGLVRQEVCVTVLPGHGFFPMPDIVVQARLKDAGPIADALHPEITRINELFVQRAQDPPWHATKVAGQTVFWRHPTTVMPGASLPLVMRPVIFQTRERDHRDRERHFLVAGLTSTTPEALVRRWLELPRADADRRLPTRRKTEGQIWINWAQLYRWIVPYVNVGLSAIVREATLPAAGDIAAQLSDAEISARLGYTGLTLEHKGPLPLGVLAVPLMAGLAVEEADAAGSDLARERLACRRLRVLYHHAELFHRDLGRWPAEVGELDGYIDFAGHPELLKLDVSARQRWTDWLEGLFESGDRDDDPDDDDDAGPPALAEDLYTIDWGATRWRLGYVEGTLEHLEQLYIDHEGIIHRVPRQDAKSSPPPAAQDDRAQES